MEKKFNFKPMQWVLGRWRNKGSQWTLCQFSHINDQGFYIMCGGECYPDCIPYKGNKHLLGTTDDYVEPFEPKDGDFVKMEGLLTRRCYIGIYRGCDGDDIITYAITDLQGELDIDTRYLSKDICLASEEEKQLLLSKLHENGKDWDAEKKAIIDYKWKPKEGEPIYIPMWDYKINKFIPHFSIYGYNECRDFLKKNSNSWIFNMKKECQAFCDKLNKVISEVK